MTDGLLENIIELEKCIQAEVAAEQIRVEKWQLRELARLQRDKADSTISEEARCQELLAAQEAQLKNEGNALEMAARAWCKRLSALDDEILHDVLKRHLAAILPGGDYDHPHGQS